MLLADGVLGLFLIGLWLYCILDVITTPQTAVKHLPKLVWLLIVLLLADIGSIVWLFVGRDRTWKTQLTNGVARTGTNGGSDRPSRPVPANPDDDEAFLRQVRERAESQRRVHEQQRQAERRAEDDRSQRRPDDE